MTMQQLKLEPGRKYRGSAWVNSYGELHFRPEQKGSKPSNLSIVMEHESFTFYESKDYFKLTMKFRKGSSSTHSLTARFLFILSQIKSYL